MNNEELLADIKNKLTPFKNLLEMMEDSELLYHDEITIHNLIEKEIENCKIQIKYFETLK